MRRSYKRNEEGPETHETDKSQTRGLKEEVASIVATGTLSHPDTVPTEWARANAGERLPHAPFTQIIQKLTPVSPECKY